MLPTEAAAYFRSLCAKRFADIAIEFSHRLRAFERAESARGQVGGSGYAVRLAGLYEEQLRDQAKAIVAIQREVHQGFGSPLEPEVVEQLQAWGQAAIEDRFDAMKGAFGRELGRYGCAVPDFDFSHSRALASVTVSNVIADEFWTMRNVPMSGKKPIAGTTVNNTFNAPIGVAQFGDGNTANVQHQTVQGDPIELLRALDELRLSLRQGSELAEARADIDRIEAALRSSSPDRGQVTKWLAGVATTVQAIASVHPALDTVRKAAAALGLPF
jgi:hypothetical protein